MRNKLTTHDRQLTGLVRQVFLLMLLVVGCWSLVGVNLALAQTPTEYELLAPVPIGKCTGAANEECTTNTAEFLPGLFRLAIMLATGLAVIMIMWGGFKYLYSDAFGKKSEAKDIIWNAISGLLLAVSAWLIINTINPNMLNFDLTVINQVGSGSALTEGGVEGDIPLPTDLSNCANCGVVKINHKRAPNGCAAPGPCIIDNEVNNKLVDLDSRLTGANKIWVTEAFPPTRVHKNPCHAEGTCVDANFLSQDTNLQKIKAVIEEAQKAGLRAVYEVTDESRASAIRQQTGLSADQVDAVGRNSNGDPWITGEHFSIYKM